MISWNDQFGYNMEMSRIEKTLSQLEASLRAIVEGDIVKSRLPRKFHNQLLNGLIRAMQAGVNESWSDDVPGRRILTAPDKYTLILPIQQAQILLTHPSVLDQLAKSLINMAARENMVLDAPPMLRVVADPFAVELHVQVEFSHTRLGDSFTTELDESQVMPSPQSGGLMPKAFLIVNGLSTYPLKQPVTNIGSDSSNHLVIGEPGISDRHAQLRLIEDRYVIFDLGSRSGTHVNGLLISSHALIPGDVILLAGIPLVFGMENESVRGYTQKLPAVRGAPEYL